MHLRNLYRKIENSFSVLFVVLLTGTPLLFKLLQSLKITIVNADTVQVHLVFIFACIAGSITWREDKHISLASLTELLPPHFHDVIYRIRTGAVTAILTAMFFSAFSEAFVAFTPEQKIWGFPTAFVFSFLPAVYGVILIRSIFRSKYKVSVLIGLLAGLFIAMGPLTGVLFYLFKLENLTFLYKITDLWLSFSSAFFIPLILFIIFLAVLGVPLFIAISAAAYVAFSQGGGYVEVLSLEAFSILTDKSIAAIPLFTIAGYLLSQGSAGVRLIEVFKALFGWFRGGTVIAAVIVTTFFTTFTGASGVTILALGSLLTIALCGTGSSKIKAQSLVTASGALGLLFPPSVAIIMYGTTNYFTVDVYDLFKGAVIPGAILAVSMIVLGFIQDKQKNRPSFSFSAVISSLKYGSFELLMPILIISGYFTGFFSIMEAAAFALLYAFILETFIRKDFTFKESLKVLAGGIPITGGVLLILASARGLSYFLVDANVPQLLSDYIVTFIHSKYLFLFLLNIFLIFVGCLMDIYSAILIVSPLIIPIAESFGIPAVHTGVIFLMNMQLGFLTPPVGMDLFIASYTFETPIMRVVKGILPYLAVQAAVLLLITYVPWFTSVLL